jgi:uncharacterized protein (TIGR02594 family)
MFDVPAPYRWLNSLGQLPRMTEEALKLLGTIETPGAANNPAIMAWAAEVGLARVYTADAIPWCGLFMAVVAHRAGKDLPSSPLWALSWAKFGTDAGQPRLGDVLTFVRDGGGHVAQYIGEDADLSCARRQSARLCVLHAGSPRRGSIACAARSIINPPATAAAHIDSARRRAQQQRGMT